jgi:hypothetical protein
MPRLLARSLAVFLAFGVGWVTYMVGMVLTVYDGLPSLVLQPILAALWSGGVVFLSLLVGLLLRVPPVWRAWHGSRLWATSIAGASLLLLVFGASLGLTYVGVDPETDHRIVMLHPAAALAGYFCLVFSIANWPVRGGAARG